MKKFHKKLTNALFGLVLLGGSLSLSSCVEKQEFELKGVQAFDFDVKGTGYFNGKTFRNGLGSPEHPFPLIQKCSEALKQYCTNENSECRPGTENESCENTFFIRVKAKDAYGKDLDVSGKLLLRAEPGSVEVIGSAKDESKTNFQDVRASDIGAAVIEMKNGKIGNFPEDHGGKSKKDDYVEVKIYGAFGSTHIWVEDSIPQAYGTFDPNYVRNKERNDNLTLSEEESEKCHNNPDYCRKHAAASSPTIYFDRANIPFVQTNSMNPSSDSALKGKYIDIRGHEGMDLVVTNVVQTGFYMTDLNKSDFNSMFVFTFKQPDRMKIGDRLCEVAGGVNEFVGMTQLSFPSWGIQNRERSSAEEKDPAPEDGDEGKGSCIDPQTGQTSKCSEKQLEAKNDIVDCRSRYPDTVKRIKEQVLKDLQGKPGVTNGEIEREVKRRFGTLPTPTPKMVDPEFLLKNFRSTHRGDSDKFMYPNIVESLEGSVVQINDVYLSSFFVNCDDNGNSKIDGPTESACRKKCNENVDCTELSNYYSYGQWRGYVKVPLPGGKTKNADLSVANSEQRAGFNILAEGCKQLVHKKFEGLEREQYDCTKGRKLKSLIGNFKQVIPTCNKDVVCDLNTAKFGIIIIEPRFSSDLIFDKSTPTNSNKP